MGLDSKPVQNVEVYCQPVAEPGMGGRASVLTDSDGRFFLDRVIPGTNTIHASKPDDGYPDTLFAFFVTDANEIPRVPVVENEVTAGVIVRLGPRHGRLTGSILDAETGVAIVRSAIRLYHQRNPDMYAPGGYVDSAGRGGRV